MTSTQLSKLGLARSSAIKQQQERKLSREVIIGTYVGVAVLTLIALASAKIEGVI